MSFEIEELKELLEDITVFNDYIDINPDTDVIDLNLLKSSFLNSMCALEKFLREFINSAENEEESLPRRPEYYATEEQFRACEINDREASMYTMVKRFNGLVNQAHMVGMSGKKLCSLLEENGYVKKITRAIETPVYIPTQLGEEHGLKSTALKSNTVKCSNLSFSREGQELLVEEMINSKYNIVNH